MITGSAIGIGQADAGQLSARGMQVALAGVDAPTLREVPVRRAQRAGQTIPPTSIDDVRAECALAQS